MEELDYLIECLHQGGFQASIASVLEEIDTDGDGRISMDEFVAINDRYPLLLFPAFRFQKSIMGATFSERFWTRKRTTLSNSKKNREQRQNKLRQRKRFDVLVARTKLAYKEIGPLSMIFHAMESLVRHKVGLVRPQPAPPLCEGANFVSVPTALANKVLFANGLTDEERRRRRRNGDESPGSASRRAGQGHAEERRGRTRDRSMKRKKNKGQATATVVPEKPAPSSPKQKKPAAAAAAAAPPPGRGRRWSQEALAAAAPAPE